MDMQGTPIGNSATGTKNTSTPAPPKQEGPGAVTKDSLAAESSAFDDKYTQKVSGSNSTFNTTDTSGATEIAPTDSASSRPSGSESYSTPGGQSGSGPDAAPSHVSDVYTQDKAAGKPKGNNLAEGDIPDDAPNASFTTSVDDKNDPGRLGAAQMQSLSAGDAADAGMPKTQKGLDTAHPYQSLSTDESA